MAREIWIRADAYGIEFDEMGNFRVRATCGLHDLAQGDLLWASFASVSDIPRLECRARGIVNSSNTALVMLKDGSYAPLGRADGKAEIVAGMQFRTIRNEMSRDHGIDFLPSKANAEKWCLLMSRFRGTKGTMMDILAYNHVRFEHLDAKRLAYIYTALSALSLRNVDEMLEIPPDVRAMFQG